jgi:hypothetical protein
MNMRKIVMSAALAAAAATAAAPAAAFTSGICKTPNSFFSTSTDPTQTSSSTFTELPEGGFAIKTTKTGCFVVSFVADTYIYPSDTVVVEAKLDQKLMDPGPMNFDDGDFNLGASHTATWAVDNLAPGVHDLSIYWKVQGGSTTASMGYSTTTVLHR